MVVASLALGWRLVIFLAAGVGAGVSNGIAGGGTFILFPTMLALGVAPLQANVSSTVGVLPSFFGALHGFRDQIGAHRRLIRSLAPWCTIGTLLGTALLLLGSPRTFQTIVPWLVGVATALFAAAPLITKQLAHVEHSHPARRGALFVGAFCTSVYGGYFGAGLGILLLALMAVTLPLDLLELQGLRSVLSLLISALAALVFIARGHLALDAVAMMLVGTFIGGTLGVALTKRLPTSAVRALIVTIGIATTIWLALN